MAGPTHKVAGISFQDVSDSAAQSIASWIAREKAGSHATERKAGLFREAGTRGE